APSPARAAATSSSRTPPSAPAPRMLRTRPACARLLARRQLPRRKRRRPTVRRLKDRTMKIAVKTIEGGSAGESELADGVFAVPVRKDILQRCVVWQLSRRQQGTHKTKGRAEVTATAKKMYAQKGTGRARHGNEAAPQFRGGGKAFGPVVRSHASDLPKKVRKLALRSALSSKAAEGKLIIVDAAALAKPKTAKPPAPLATLSNP